MKLKLIDWILPKTYFPTYMDFLMTLLDLYVSLILEASLMGLSWSLRRKKDLNSLPSLTIFFEKQRFIIHC